MDHRSINEYVPNMKEINGQIKKVVLSDIHRSNQLEKHEKVHNIDSETKNKIAKLLNENSHLLKNQEDSIIICNNTNNGNDNINEEYVNAIMDNFHYNEEEYVCNEIDINLVMSETKCTYGEAKKSLINNKGDLVATIMELID